MPETRLNWSALSADEISAILADPKQRHPDQSTPFLDCHQWVPLAGRLGWDASGGFTAAQMRCLHPAASPPAIQYWQFELDGLPVHLRTSRGLSRHLRHETDEDSIGDVYQSSDRICLAALSGFEVKLQHAGGKQLDDPPVIEQAIKRATVASLRLDAVCAAIFQISREEAQTATEYGFLYINFQECTKRSAAVKSGDIIVFRNKGKAKIAGGEINPRSKRYWLDYSVNLI